MPAMPGASTPGRPVPAPVWLACAAVVAVLAVHAASVAELVSVWYRSVSYNHCFLVLPVSAWLIWRDRARLDRVVLGPWWPGLALLALLSFLWLVGRVTSINSLRDLAVVATLPVLLVTLLGRGFGRVMVFPLAFLMFAWPFGEILIPVFIDRTADFTVWALRASGVPVFREGNSFVIPSGTWSVVEECSGIRYLMASMSAGSVFAHVNMRSVRRRWIFFGLSVLVPILANWLRAYLIVLLGHVSNNRLATGVDHLVYGWVFFGAVMTGLFYFGARWADAPAPRPRTDAKAREPRPIAGTMVAAAIAAIIAVAAGPGWTLLTDRATPMLQSPLVAMPAARGGWQEDGASHVPWAPKQPGALAAERRTYARDGATVGLAIAVSYEQGDGEKLLTFAGTALADYDTIDPTLSRSRVPVPQFGPGFEVVERKVRTGGRVVLAWQWYRIDERFVDRLPAAKWHQARARIAGRHPLVAVYTLSTAFGDEPEAARARLRAFLELHMTELARPPSTSPENP